MNANGKPLINIQRASCCFKDQPPLSPSSLDISGYISPFELIWFFFVPPFSICSMYLIRLLEMIFVNMSCQCHNIPILTNNSYSLIPTSIILRVYVMHVTNMLSREATKIVIHTLVDILQTIVLTHMYIHKSFTSMQCKET